MTIKKILFHRWFIIAGLLLICAICYGPLITVLGLYWDDWPSLWFLHFYGPQIFPQAFSIDRPVQGWLFVPTTFLVGESLLAWQVFGILARTLSAVALGWVMISLWPKKKLQVLGIAILFLVYPGFSQQYIAITYGHQFLIMSAFLASLGIMIWSIRVQRRYWVFTGASLVIALLSMFALEYYFGLVLLRPVLIWIVIGETIRSPIGRLRKTIRYWLPYLALDVLFLTWRLTHSTPRGEVTIFKNLTVDPLRTVIELGQTILNDIYESAILAWAKAFAYLNTAGIKRSVVLVYFGIVIAAAVVSFLLLMLTKTKSSPQVKSFHQDLWWRSAVLIGIYALLIGGWPIWVTDLRLDLTVPWDRFTQPMMVGTSLVVVGLIDLIFRPRIAKIAVLAILAGLAAGNHFHDAMNYRQEWIDQRAFFWQLAWRAPVVKPGTAFLTSGLPFKSSTDNSLTAPINWIYAPDLTSREMPYAMYDVEARLGNSLPSLDPGISLSMDYRATHFTGSTSQALAFYYKPPRCVKILDLRTDRHYPNKPGYVVLAMPLSQLDLIEDGGAEDPTLPDFLGPEPKHNWCYYFEKAELAVQLEQWEKASRLADQALQTKPELTQDNAPELIPFIYAYARAGKYDKARDLSLQAGSLSNKMHYYTCDTWYYLGQQIKDDPVFTQTQAEINTKFECSTP